MTSQEMTSHDMDLDEAMALRMALNMSYEQEQDDTVRQEHGAWAAERQAQDEAYNRALEADREGALQPDVVPALHVPASHVSASQQDVAPASQHADTPKMTLEELRRRRLAYFAKK